MLKVCKFGGTSMATKKSLENVKDILNAESARKFAVVSAPGKRFSDDIKVTDLLYKAFDEKDSGGDSFAKIRARFVAMASDLGLSVDINAMLDEVEQGIKESVTADYSASRGEYLSAKLFAEYIGREFIDASEIMKFNEDGSFNYELSNDIIKKRLENSPGAIIGGFYGAMPDGTIKTFSRGGSDVTGSIIARGVSADIYENWTDVNGFFTCDPRLVPDAKNIEVVSYEELRELSYMGASVLHPESVFPVQRANIPINIRNTFNPDHPGTMIVPATATENHPLVTGIAGKKGYITILIKKAMMNNELGFARKVLSVLEYNGISLEHIPTGIDTMSIIISSQGITPEKEKKISDEIMAKVSPDTLTITHGLALVAVVGHGMANQKGTAAKLFNALYGAGVNIRLIDQGSSEMNIIVGVEEADFDISIKAIYKAFF